MCPPPMTMFFHSRISEVILFRSWIPTTPFVFTMGFVFELLRMCRAYIFQFGGTKTSLETNIDQKPVPKQVESVTPSTCCCEGEVSGPADEETFAAKEGKQTCVVLRPSTLSVSCWPIVQSLLHFVQLALSLSLMLIAMTYNIGLFVALCAGHVAGYATLGLTSSRLQEGVKEMEKLGATGDCCCA